MLPRTYEEEHCSIAGTLEVLGDRWTLLILREACRGVTRFADFQSRLGLARTVLSDRLTRLTTDGIFERRRYQERPDRYEYLLTPRGRDVWPILNALMNWGDQHVMGGLAPVVVRHVGCGGRIDGRRRCESCGADVELGDTERHPGPGAPAPAVATPAATVAPDPGPGGQPDVATTRA